MALLPPSFMDAVVALGVQSSEVPFQGTATGFLYGHPTGEIDDNGEPLFSILLVTNRHVVECAVELAARFNRSMTAEAKAYPIPLHNPDNSIRWTVHPDPTCDVAVIYINTDVLEEEGIYYQWFRGDDAHSLSAAKAQEIGVSEGDGVFVLGFPLGLVGEKCNYTVVRQGSIARVRDWLYGNAKSFLIDASVFPGNSGGPVIVKPEATAIDGTKANRTAYLIGMVSEYLTYQDVAVSQQTGETRVAFVENSGLGVVVPVEVIQETIALAVEPKPPQAKTPPRKPLGQWLVENMPRGTNLEISGDRNESGRAISFHDEEETR